MAKNRPSVKNPGKKSINVAYSIVKIELVNSSITIPQGFKFNDLSGFTYDFEADINIIKDKSVIQIIITYEFSFKGATLLIMRVENDFTVMGLPEILVNDNIGDINFTAFLINLSLHHARGIQSTLVKDTPISSLYIPILDKSKIIEKIKQK